MSKSGQAQTRVLVSNTPSGALRPFTDRIEVLASSLGAPWDDVLSVEFDVLAPGEMEDCYISRTIIAQPLTPDTRHAIERLGDFGLNGNATVNDVIHIDPQGELTGVRWTAQLDVLFLMPSELTFQRVLGEMRGHPSKLDLMRTSYVEDIQIRQIGLAVLAECRTGFPSGRLYGESLALALAARLVNCYSTATTGFRADKDGLPAWRLRRVTDFIEENLDADLGLTEIAAVAGFSEYHFSRMFKSRTGITPHRYVVQRRVERAKYLLARSEISIKEISVSLGFSDQAHFTTVFKTVTGLTPRQFRAQIG